MEHERQRKQEVLAIAEFLGDNMTSDQVNSLIDEIRGWSLDGKFYIADYLDGGPLYTAIREHLAEIGEYY